MYRIRGGHLICTTIAPEATPEVTPEVKKMRSIMTGEVTRGEIQKKLGLKDEKHFRESYQQVSVKLGLIEMTVVNAGRATGTNKNNK